MGKRLSIRLDGEHVLFIEQFVNHDKVNVSDVVRMMLDIVMLDGSLSEKLKQDFVQFKKEKSFTKLVDETKALTRSLYWKNNLMTHLLRLCGGDFFTRGNIDFKKANKIINKYLELFNSFKKEHKEVLKGDYDFVKSLDDKDKLTVALMNHSKFKTLIEFKEREVS